MIANRNQQTAFFTSSVNSVSPQDEKDPIHSLVVLPDGVTQVSLQGSKFIIEDQKKAVSSLQASQKHDELYALANGKHVLSYTKSRCKYEYTVDVWDCQAKSKVHTFDSPGWITTGIACSVNANYLIRNILKLETLESYLELYDISNIAKPILLYKQAGYENLDSIMALPGRESEFIIGRLRTGYERWKVQDNALKIIEKFDTERTPRELSAVIRPTAIAVTADGKQLVSGHQGGIVKIWQLGNDNLATVCQKKLEIDTGKFVNAIQVIPNSPYIVLLIENDLMLCDISQDPKVVDTVHQYMGLGFVQLSITKEREVVSKETTVSFAKVKELNVLKFLEENSKEINRRWAMLFGAPQQKAAIPAPAKIEVVQPSMLQPKK